MAEGQPPAQRATWCSSSRSAAAASRRTSARISCAALQYASDSRRRRSSASSAATAATRPRSPTPASIVPTVNPETVTPHTRGVPGGGLAPARLASAAEGQRRRSGNRRGERTGRLSRPRRRAQPGDGPRRQALSAAVARRARDPAGRAGGAATLKSRGLLAGRRHQSARRGARHARPRAVVEAIHAAPGRTLPLDEFRVCLHDDGDRCDCRKPKPGLLLAAPALRYRPAERHGRRSLARRRGRRAAGCCATILIDYGYEKRSRTNRPCESASLPEASRRGFFVGRSEEPLPESRSKTNM